MNKPIAEQVAEVLKNLTEGDPEFLQELINAYIENLHEFRSEASVAIRNRDLNALKAQLHKVNPTLITLKYGKAYEELSAITGKLDGEAVEDNIRQVESVTQELLDMLHHVRQII